jgi:hypothetical protein
MTNPTDKQSDIVAELREHARGFSKHSISARLANGAADELERLRDLAQMVDAWGNGLRHPTEHERKMVATARALSHSATKETTE